MSLRDLEPLSSAQRDGTARAAWLSSQDRSCESCTLTKAGLVETLSEHIGLSKLEVRELVDAFFEVIGEALESGENARLSRFGSFRLRDKRQRQGRNPKTGETIPIAARRVVVFHPSRKLNAEINADLE